MPGSCFPFFHFDLLLVFEWWWRSGFRRHALGFFIVVEKRCVLVLRGRMAAAGWAGKPGGEREGWAC